MPDRDEEPTFDPFEAPLVPRQFRREQDDGDATGRRIGPYVLLEKVGQGGMGQVYKARRAEGFEDRVAIKIISTDDGRADPELSARFLSERQSLAWLRHKHIATLLDGGETEDGTPYLVMELIDGMPIDEYCEQGNLTRSDRMRLFRQVCEAVEFAHRVAVVHRDIKPSNILVTIDGEVKLLDFGIAKIVRDHAEAESGQELAATRFRGRVSLAYASPEQIDRALGVQVPVTTATDVYSLGVLLCELLTGQLPLDLRGRSFSESIDIIQNQEPQIDAMGSKKLSPEEVAILRRMLQKMPDQRYGNIQDIVADLDAMEAGCPVSSLEYSAVSRSIKAIKRHRIAALLSTASVAAVLGIGIAVIVQADAARRAQLANIEHEQRAAIMMFLDLAVKLTDPTSSPTDLSMVDFLLAATEPEALRVLDGYPEAEGSFKFAAGRTLQRLGHPVKALPLLEEAESLLSTDRGLTGASLIDVKMALAEIYGVNEMPQKAQEKIDEIINFGNDNDASDEWLASYRVELLMSNIQAAEYHEAALLADQLRPLFARPDAPKLLASKFYRALGLLEQVRENLGEAERLYRFAIRLTDDVGDDLRAAQWARLDAKDRLADVLFYQSKFSEALAELAECETLAEQLFGVDATRYLGIRLRRADRLYFNREFDIAIEIYDECLASYAAQMGDHHPRVIMFQYHFAHAYFLDKQPGQASEVLSEAMEHLAHMDQPDVKLLAECRYLLLRVTTRLGDTVTDHALEEQVLRDLSNPESSYDEFVPDKITLLMSDSAELERWDFLSQLSECYLEFFQKSGAIPESRDIERLGIVLFSSIQPSSAQEERAATELAVFIGEVSSSVEEQASDEAILVLERIAFLLSKMGSHSESATLFDLLSRCRTERFGAYHGATLAASTMAGTELMQDGRLELAEQRLRSVFALCESHLSVSTPAFTATVNALAVVLTMRGNWLDAEDILTNTIERASHISPEPAIGLAYLHRCLAKGYDGQGARGQAVDSMLLAIEYAKRAQGFPAGDLMNMQLWLGQRRGEAGSNNDE